MEQKNKKTNLWIIAQRFSLPVILALLAQDNPGLRPKIKEMLKAYGE